MSHLIEIIGQRGLLDAAGMSRARQLLNEGKTLEDAVLAADGFSEQTLLQVLADIYDVPYVDVEKVEPDREFLSQFPVRVLVEHNVLPLELRSGRTLVAVSRLSDSGGALDQLRLATGRDCTPALAPAGEIGRALKRLLGVGADTLQSLDAAAGIEVISEDENDLDVSSAAHDASIIKFVNQVLIEAIESRATDVHVNLLRTSFVCVTALTACCRKPMFRPASGGFMQPSCRASRFWRIWTLPKNACPRTGASSSSWRAGKSTCACRSFP